MGLYRIAFVLAIGLSSLVPLSAQAQSFNCRTANRPDEVMICQDRHLSSLDERMSSLYFTLRNRLGGAERRALEAAQTSWLESRFACGRDYGCIERRYDRRIDELNNY
jgi:uncharacterized protein